MGNASYLRYDIWFCGLFLLGYGWHVMFWSMVFKIMMQIA